METFSTLILSLGFTHLHRWPRSTKLHKKPPKSSQQQSWIFYVVNFHVPNNNHPNRPKSKVDNFIFFMFPMKTTQIVPTAKLNIFYFHVPNKNHPNDCPNSKIEFFLFHVPNKTSQELWMLSSVTINCQITKMFINSGSQLLLLSPENLKIFQKSEYLPKIWKSFKNLKIFQKSVWSNVSKVTSL